MNLREATQDLHHAAERHPLGAAMADGSISEQWWADWLGALFIIHSTIDPELPTSLRRTVEIARDIAELGIQPNPSRCAMEYVQSLSSTEATAYVFTGAHLMGGAITAGQVGDRLPTHHLQWNDRRESVREWKPWRERDDLAEDARLAFSAVIGICEEITSRD